MESGAVSRTSSRLSRLLVLVAFTLALVAVALPTSGVSAGNVSQEGSALTYQVYTCPIDYSGTEYLADCEAGTVPYDIVLTGNAGQVDLRGTTDGNGFISFLNIPAGTVTASLEVPGDFARFYYACFTFDPASGNQIYLFDGTGNQLTQEPTGEPGSALLCRWYVTPESQGGPTPAPSQTEPDPDIGSVDVQVYVCPVAYAGNEYLEDCSPTDSPIGVLLSPSVPFDSNDYFATQTVAEGRVAFDGLEADEYSVAVDVPGDFADFYHACFDVTSGSEVFLFDGDLNTASFDLADQIAVSCRFYVIPEDLRGESAAPSVRPTAVPPTATPPASARPAAVDVLPSTGTGPDSGSPADEAALAVLAVVAIAAVGLVTRRLVTATR